MFATPTPRARRAPSMPQLRPGPPPMLSSRSTTLLSPRKPATPSQLRDRAAWKKTPEVRRSLRSIETDDSDFESNEPEGDDRRTTLYGISGLPRRMHFTSESQYGTPTMLSPTTGLFERNPTPLYGRGRGAATPSGVTPRRRTLGNTDTAIPHDRYQFMPDGYFLHDGTESSEQAILNGAESQELLKDIVFMQDNIKHMQSLPHIYVFEHLELDVKPTSTHYGRLSSAATDDVFSTPFLSPDRKRLRHSISSSALLDRHHDTSTTSAQIPRPYVRSEDIARAEMCLDWLAAFERDDYWKYQRQSAGIIESGYSSAAPACFLQTSTQALVLEVTYAREYLRRECQIQRALTRAQALRAEWDQKRWEINEGAERLRRRLDDYVRQETAWVRGGKRLADGPDDSTGTEEGLPERSQSSSKKSMSKSSAGVTITLSELGHDSGLLQRRLDEAWADLHSLLGMLKPCHGLRLVAPDDEEPVDTMWRKRHRDRQCKERKAPVKVWRIMQGLEKVVADLVEDVVSVQRASGGWQRARAICSRHRRLREDAERFLELARAGADASRLHPLKARLDDEFRLDDPRLDPAEVRNAPSNVDILQELDSELRVTVKLLASCSEAMNATAGTTQSSSASQQADSRADDVISRVNRIAKAAEAIVAQCHADDLPPRKDTVTDESELERQAEKLAIWRAELIEAEAAFQELSAKVSKGFREPQGDGQSSTPGAARRALASANRSIQEARSKIKEAEIRLSESRSTLDLIDRLDQLDDQTSDLEIDLLRALESSKWHALVPPPSEEELRNLSTAVADIEQQLEEAQMNVMTLASTHKQPSIVTKAENSRRQVKIVSVLYQSLQRVSEQRRYAEEIATKANAILNESSKTTEIIVVSERIDALEHMLIATPMVSSSDWDLALDFRRRQLSSSRRRDADILATPTPPGSPSPTDALPDLVPADDSLDTSTLSDEHGPAMLALDALAESDQRIRTELNELFLRVKAAVGKDTAVGANKSSEPSSQSTDAANSLGAQDPPGSCPARPQISRQSNSATENAGVVPHPLLEVAVKKAVRRSLPKHAGDLQVVASAAAKIDKEYVVGAYTFAWGDKSYTRFCRTMLGRDKALVMVRVGGGWEGLDDFINHAFASVFEKTHTLPVSPEADHAALLGIASPAQSPSHAASPSSAFQPSFPIDSPAKSTVFTFRSGSRAPSESPEMPFSAAKRGSSRPASPMPLSPLPHRGSHEPLTAHRPPTPGEAGGRRTVSAAHARPRTESGPPIPRPPSWTGRHNRGLSNSRTLSTRPSLTEMAQKIRDEPKKS